MRRCFGLLLIALTACARKPQHPNVLLITLDTFRADRIGPATPNLLRLAKSGVWFHQADSVAPLTLPSHATILSGLLPPHHGLRNNGAGSFPDRRGEVTVDRALAWLRKSDPRPWFAWVHLYDAHAPYAPPPPFPQTYDGEVAYVDKQVGRLLNENAIIIIVGDHGESLGEHGELTHGLLTYESTLHVPLIIADLTRGTGRFNSAQGVVGTMTGLGAAFSATLAAG